MYRLLLVFWHALNLLDVTSFVAAMLQICRKFDNIYPDRFQLLTVWLLSKVAVVVVVEVVFLLALTRMTPQY